LVSAEAELLAKDARNRNQQGADEQNTHDSECKDPLQGNDLDEELTDTKCSCENGKTEAHGIVLVDDEEEHSIDQNTPDGNIGEDTRDRTSCVDSDSTIPVQGDESPSQWSRNSGDVNQTGMGRVAEVQEGQIEEVEDQDDLSPDKVSSNEEHDECELKEVIEDEVGTNSSSSLDMGGGIGEEVPHVCDLEEEQSEPVERQDNLIQEERS